MADMMAQPVVAIAPEMDLVSAVHRVLAASPAPMTIAKIQAALPGAIRNDLSPERLGEVLYRQAALQVLIQYPKYRSQQDRFWDRPMEVHLEALLRAVLRDKPLAWSEIRRKLPDYGKVQAWVVLEDLVERGNFYRHPPLRSRTGPRFGLTPPDPREFLRPELARLFHRLEIMGFAPAQLREGALDLLHEEIWTEAENSQASSTLSPS